MTNPSPTVKQYAKLTWLALRNPGSTWHYANCGCCVCFHPGGLTDRGWIIGPDGEAEYHEH